MKTGMSNKLVHGIGLLLVALPLTAVGCGHCGGGCCGGGEGYRPAPPPVASQIHEHGVPQGGTTAPAAPAYAGQKTCPVTGESLGSMGAPIPVTIKGDTVYVCCRGCVAKVQRNPDQYLAKVLAERGVQ